ncbi:MAG: dihydrodipicolinate reductase, partial [Spirochaetota bacterium]
MIKTVIVTGNGKLSHSIMNGLPEYLCECNIDRWENNENYPHENKVIVHAGSGRQFGDVINFCGKTKSPLIQVSTNIAGNFTNADFTFIDAPNLDILMLKFMHMMKLYGSSFKKYKISIIESHQAAKTSLPGTALEFAKSLGVDPEKITSIRDPEV